MALRGLADGVVARRDLATLQQLEAMALTKKKHNPAAPFAHLHQGGGGGGEGIEVGGQGVIRQRLADGLRLAAQQQLHPAPQHGPPRRLLCCCPASCNLRPAAAVRGKAMWCLPGMKVKTQRKSNGQRGRGMGSGRLPPQASNAPCCAICSAVARRYGYVVAAEDCHSGELARRLVTAGDRNGGVV